MSAWVFLKQPIHLISWCGTRMEYFLEAFVIVFNKLLAPLYDTLFSLNIREEERDTLFTAENIYTFQVMCGLHHSFHNKWASRQIDSSGLSSIQNRSGQSQWNAWPGNTYCLKILRRLGYWSRRQHNCWYWIEWQQRQEAIKTEARMKHLNASKKTLCHWKIRSWKILKQILKFSMKRKLTFTLGLGWTLKISIYLVMTKFIIQ